VHWKIKEGRTSWQTTNYSNYNTRIAAELSSHKGAESIFWCCIYKD